MEFAYEAVKLLHAGYSTVRSYYRWVCSGRADTSYSAHWVILEDSYSVEEVTRTRPDGRVDVRRAICRPDRAPYTYQSLFEPVGINWLSIRCGLQYMTDAIAPYMCGGNLVTPTFLKSLGSGTWYYMDPTTFEELEFPSNGILIK